MAAPPPDDAKDPETAALLKELKARPSKLPLIVAVVNTIGLVGLAGFIVLSRGKGSGDEGGAKGEKAGKAGKSAHEVADQAGKEHQGDGKSHDPEAAPHGEDESRGDGDSPEGAAHGPTAIVPLGVFLVNLKEPGGDRFLKARVGLEVLAEGEAKKAAEEKVPKVRYEIIMVLSDLRVVDVSGPEKIESLKKVMLQRARKALAPEIKVTGIYPDEWVIQ